MASLFTNTELFLANTTNNSGTINLPAASSIPGRVIEFKDSAGTFQTKTLTLVCNGADKFEDGSSTKVMNTTFGNLQLVASGSKWYILNGTQVNTFQVSTLTTQSISTFLTNTSSMNVSSFTLIDNRNSTNTLYTSTSFLLYNNFIISGTRVGYSNVFNKYTFSPFVIPNLALWLDAADTSSVITSGVNVTAWNDKSGNARNLTTKVGTITYGEYQGLYCIQNANNSYIYKLNPVDLTQYTFFIVCLSATNVTNQTVFCAIPQSNIYNSSNSFDSFGFFVDANTPQSRFYGSLLANNVTDAATSSNGNSYPLRMMAYTETSNTLLNSFVNGNTGSTNVGISTRSNTCQGFGVGTNFNGTSPTTGTSVSYVHEILVYNSVLLTFQRQYIEGYLAWKWGIQSTLPAGHPYKNAPP